MKRTFWSTIFVVAALAAASSPHLGRAQPAPGGQMQPIAVLSINGYDELMNDIAYLGEMSGTPGLDKTLEGAVQMFTGGQGLKGLDRKRPWGFTVGSDGAQFQPLIFLPVSDAKQLLGALAPIVGPAQDAAGGIQQITVKNQPVFVKQQNGWAFIGQTPESLGTLPADPAGLLGGLEKTYDIALRLFVRNIPEMYRTLAVDQMRAGVEAGLDRKPNESDSDFEMRKKLAQAQVQQIVTLINEADQITIGWNVDNKVHVANLDLTATAVPGSKMAAKVNSAYGLTTGFSGFLVPGAALTLNSATKIAPDDVEQSTNMLAAMRAGALKQIDKENDLDADSKEVARQVVGEILDVFKATIEAGKFDAGATVTLKDGALAAMAGAFVADSSVIEDALKKMAKLAEKEPDFPGVKFNADTHGSVRFHTMSVPVQDANAAQVLGDKLDVAVGIGPKSVYVAAGAGSLAALKSAIDSSASTPSKQLPPAQLNVSLEPILRFAAKINPDPKITAMAEELAKTKDADRVSLVAKPIKDGLNYRLEIQEGVLRLIGAASKMAQRGGTAQ